MKCPITNGAFATRSSQITLKTCFRWCPFLAASQRSSSSLSSSSCCGLSRFYTNFNGNPSLPPLYLSRWAYVYTERMFDGAHLQVKMTVVRTAETATKHATATGHSVIRHTRTNVIVRSVIVHSLTVQYNYFQARREGREEGEVSRAPRHLGAPPSLKNKISE